MKQPFEKNPVREPHHEENEQIAASVPNNAEEDTNAGQHFSGAKLYNLLAALMLAMLLLGLDMNIVATAVPSITEHFHSLQDVNWYGSAFLLSLCALQPLAGKLYVLFPSKPVYLIFNSVFSLGNLVCALSNSSHMVIAGRTLAGVGASGLTNGALVILTAATPPNLRPLATGIGISMISIGGIIGPLIGGALTQHTGWRWCFWIFLPASGLVILVTALCRVSDPTPKEPFLKVLRQVPVKLDVIGFILFAPACALFLIAISWGGTTHAWNSGVVIGFMCASVILLGVLYAWFRKLLYIPPWAIVGSALTAIGSGLMVTFNKDTSPAKWIGYQLMAGLGRGAALNMPIIAAQEALAPPEFALVSASIPLCQYLAGSISIAIGNAIFQNKLPVAIAKYVPAVNVSIIVDAGARDLAKVVLSEDLPGVLTAYSEALVKVFYVPALAVALAVLASFGLGWGKLGSTSQTKAEKEPEDRGVGGATTDEGDAFTR
ncbi:uncharacterized protein Triagg1_7700 [Trichoderma aggressivum f. europaeum]|uniref:Major facilitator superfamily (MFS) profile domain-containing protein n=1 Tax=Trichoderma aggressivum f. europaeum TaxID=173218 RepID=A0AAE1J581_9HYPO|nr:hypothetical protein Triagg1_7700 [Trichoderma aggressivum f. europaeum]